MTVLNYNPVASLRNDVHGSLLEVGKATVGSLQVSVDTYNARGVVSFISDDVTPNKIE